MTYRAPIRSVITYACPTLEYAVDAHLLKLQRLQNRVLRATGSFHRHTPVRKLRMAFNIPYIYDNMTIPYIYDNMTKLCRTQTEVILSDVNPNVCGNGQGKAIQRKYKRLKLCGSHDYDQSADFMAYQGDKRPKIGGSRSQF
jgi:hypothetical protein